jgi:hypothetical protein
LADGDVAFLFHFPLQVEKKNIFFCGSFFYYFVSFGSPSWREPDDQVVALAG